MPYKRFRTTISTIGPYVNIAVMMTSVSVIGLGYFNSIGAFAGFA